MKVRNAVALVALAGISLAPAAALAQGSAHPATPAPAATPPAAEAPVIKPATVIDAAWQRAVRAVLDGMKRLVDAERIEAKESLGALVAPSHAPVSSALFNACRGVGCIPPVRASWLPAHAWREAVESSPVQVTPVAVTPPTESPIDTRGEHAVLLGARMQLPWLVP